LKANHNRPGSSPLQQLLGFKIVKKHFESKSQPSVVMSEISKLGFKIVKKHFESKSQPPDMFKVILSLGFKIVKKHFESKSQQPQ
jgi:hypothetical protein